MGADCCPDHPHGSILLSLASGALDHHQEVTALPTVKHLAELLRQTQAVVQQVVGITGAAYIPAWMGQGKMGL